MANLTVCLKRVGDKLDPADKAAVLNRSRELRSGGMGATEAAKEAVKDVISGIRAELKASEPKPASQQNPQKKHPKTVMGSELLAIISDRLGGLDPSLISEYSVYVPTGKLDKKTKAPLMAWRNPPIPGIGLLFRRGGRQDRQEIAQVLEDADYLEPGAVANDYKEAGERAKDLIKAALDRNIPKTLAEQQAEMEAGQEAERQAYYDALDEESAREADAERAAIMAEAELSRVEVQAVDDADLLNMAGGTTDTAAQMRAMGFSEQEIADELAREAQQAQGQAAQASAAQDAEAAPGPAPEAGPAGVDAAQRGPEQAAQQVAQRSQPRETIQFARPIIGKNGSRLLSYSWQWKPMEFVDKRGEDRVARVSDWDKAEASAESGREVVHQFTVEADGQQQVVSAEGAMRVLGFLAGEKQAGVKSVVSAAKTLARLKMQEAELQQAKVQFDGDNAAVQALPLPAMPTERDAKGWWNLGDEQVRQLEPGPMTDERRRALVGAWRDKRLAERGWKQGQATRDDMQRRLTDLASRIKRAETRLNATVIAEAAVSERDARNDANWRRDDAPLLEAQTPADLKAKATREKAAADADAKEQKRLADKAKADAERGGFQLTGSDRAADVGAAAGQGDIFDQPAEALQPTNSLGRIASWVIRDKTTGAVVMETFDKKKVDALNTKRYEAVPILEYLQGGNRGIKDGAVGAIDTSPEPVEKQGGNEQNGNAPTPLLSQVSRALEQERDLIVQHNLTVENLMHAARMGGIPVPSLAVTKANAPMVNFGEITLIGPPDIADPKGYAGTKVFGADIYSPRYPSVEFKLDNKAQRAFNKTLEPFRQDNDREMYGGEVRRPDDITSYKPFKRWAANRYGVAETATTWQQLTESANALMREIGAGQRIFQGFTYSGNRKYIDHTLDNVVKILKKELRGGENFNYGVGSLRAKFTPQFRSVDAIRKAKNRLVDKATFDAIKKEIDQEFIALSDDLNLSLEQTSEVIEDAAKMGAMRSLKRAFGDYRNGLDPTDEQAVAVGDFARKLVSLPTEYFEAKVLRAVDVAEFKVAVVPKDTPKEAVDYLESRGVKVETYDKEVDKSRAETVKSAADKHSLLFSRTNIRTRGVPLSTLKPHIDAITAKMPGLRAAVEVVATVTDLPKGIVDSLRSMNALGTVRGLRMPDGRVFLVADKLDSQLEAEFVLFHEVYGHEGLRAILTGDEYARAMTLVRLSNKAVAAEADRWTAAYGADQIDARIQAGMSPEAARREVRLLAIEEALADRAGKNDPPAVWKNVMAAIQKALRRMGMDDLANWLENRTEAETYALLMQARKAITEGKPHALKQVPEGMAASSTAPTFYSALLAEVQKAPMKAGAAQAWSQYLDALTKKGAIKADEIEWTGLREWLALQPGKITQAQISEYLSENGVQVTETVLGEPENSRDLKTIEDAGYSVEANDMDGPSLLRDGEYVDADDRTVPQRVRDAMDRLAEGADGTPTKYGQYTLPGGTNYREVLLTLPSAKDAMAKPLSDATRAWRDAAEEFGEDSPQARAAREDRQRVSRKFDEAPANYRSNHWDAPNILAHIRLNDRTDADGKRVLFVEEIQSDWGQAAKRHGFAGDDPHVAEREAIKKQMSALVDERATARKNDDGTLSAAQQAERLRDITAKLNALDARMREIPLPGNQPPRAPFIGKTDAWVALAIKRVISIAAREGYDRVAFVNGEQSAERYDLSKQIDAVRYGRFKGEATYSIGFKRKGDSRFEDGGRHDAESLPNVVGKELAEKIVNSGKDDGEFSGLDLKVGGEGMKAFYDKIVPTVAKDVLRKVGGGQMGAVTVQGESKYERQFASKPEAEAWAEANLGDHSYLIVTSSEANKTFAIYDEFTNDRVPDVTRLQQPGFDITPAMREKAAAGLPLFSRRPDTMAPAVTVQPDENGNPTFHGAKVKLDYPQPAERFEFIPGPGQQLLNYAIMPSEGFDSLGFVELVVENGQVTALLDIEINGAGRRAGVGKQVIETILAANPQADVNISNIVHQARGFWAKMGVPEQNLEDGAAYDGTLNWQTYAEATNDGRAAQVGQGMQGQVRRADAGATEADGEAGRGAQAPVLSQRSDLQAQAKALGLPATGASADLANRIRIVETHPSTWTRDDFDAIAPYLSIHQDVRDNSALRVDSIMRDGLNKGMVDSLGRMKDGQWTWADRLAGGDAYAFVSGALKFKSPDSAWLAPGNKPLFHFTTQPGQDLYGAVKGASGAPGMPVLSQQPPTQGPIATAAQQSLPAQRQPLPAGWRDPTNRLQFAPGQWLYNALGRLAAPLLIKLQFKAATPEMRRQLRQMKLDVQKAQDIAVAVAGETTKLSDAEREMVSDIIEREVRAGTVPPEHAIRLAALMNNAMGEQSKELIRLGMLTPEAAARWDGAYLPRFYESKLKKQVGDAWADAFKRLTGRTSAMKGVKGSHLKSRGIYEPIIARDLEKWEQMGWEIRDPDYPPGTKAADLKSRVDAGLLQPDEKVQMWRDFTRVERNNMGEIRDSGFRFVMGYMQTQRDIALGRMFKRMAEDPASSSRIPQEGWVKVPDSTIEGTGAKRYGKLSGRYVPKETLSHLSQIEESQSAAWQMYRQGMAIWKMGKTAMNPVSHFNNIVSNLSMAHFAGVGYHRADKYVAAIRDFATAAPAIKEARDAGLFLGTMSDAELMNTLPKELQELAGKAESKTVKGAKLVFDMLTFFVRKPMGAAYQAEDTFFRYLIYKDARGRGLSPDDAIDYAQKYIFAYDDLPKGARMVRDFGIPFFAYTYKAVPALLHTALTHPVRFAAPAAVLWATNAMAYAIAAGDDDDTWAELLSKYINDEAFREKVKAQEQLERENLPPWMKGMTALATPKAIRLGMDEVTKLPMFLDVARIIPGGDIFDVSPNAGGIPLPQPITPSHPLFSIATGMIANKDLWTGKDLVDKNDTRGEAAEKRGEWLWKQVSPAMAIGNYHWERGMNALAQASGGEISWLPEFIAEDYTGVGRDRLPVQPGLAAMQTFGIKARPIDIEKSIKMEGTMREKMIRDITAELRTLNRLNQDGVISDTRMEKERAKTQLKIDRLREGLTVDGDEKP